MCDGFEHGTERGIGRRYGEAKCSERSDRRGVGNGAPDTNCDYYERVESPRVVWITRTGDKARGRGASVAQEPRIVLGVFASNSGTKVGVVRNGELDGDDDAPVMVKTVHVGAKWLPASSSSLSIAEVAGLPPSGSLLVSLSGGASAASDRSRTQVARDGSRVAADLRCGRMAVMAWSCRKRRWLR